MQSRRPLTCIDWHSDQRPTAEVAPGDETHGKIQRIRNIANHSEKATGWWFQPTPLKNGVRQLGVFAVFPIYGKS